MIAAAPAGVPPPVHFRPSLAGRIGVIVAALVIGALTLFMLALAIGLAPTSLPIAIVLGATGLVMASLTALVAREAVARQRLSATLYAGALTARLPKRRGFIAMEKEALTARISDIAAIETRLEHFESLGVSTAQRAYRLILRDGAMVALGADREMLPPFFGPLAAELAARTGTAIVDRGVVDGKAGFLLVAGHSAPDWETASLSPPEAARRAHTRRRTAAVIGAAALIVIVARMAASR